MLGLLARCLWAALPQGVDLGSEKPRQEWSELEGELFKLALPTERNVCVNMQVISTSQSAP